MCALRLDLDTFNRRVEKLYDRWKNNEQSEIRDLDVISIGAGKFESVYGKTASLHVWLFGYELQDTAIAFCENSILVLCGKKKYEFLQPLTKYSNDKRKFVLILRNQADKDKAGIEKLIAAMKDSKKGKHVGHLPKDKCSSELTDSFQSAIQAAKFELHDISGFLSGLFAVKDDAEVSLVKKACDVTCNVFNKYLKEEIMDIIDYDKKVKHQKLAAGCHDALRKPSLLNGLDPDNLEMCYDPIVQSGGKYNCKFSVESDDQILHFGTIICSLGIRYQSYCSNIIRSLMVNPTEEQSSIYAYLHDLFDWAIGQIKPGVKFADFCQSIHNKVASERPDLADKLVRSFGFVTGIEFRDSHQLLSSKSTEEFAEGMTLNFNIAFQNLPNPKGETAKDKEYALWIGDIVGVGLGENKTNMVYTLAAKRRPKSISLYIKEEEEEEEEEEDEASKTSDKNKNASSAGTKKDGKSLTNGDGTNADDVLGRGHRRAIIEQKTRNEQNAEERRMSRRRELFDALVTSSTNRLSGMKNDTGLDTKMKSTVAYKGAGQMPKEEDVQKLRLFVDKKYETIILPIFGLPTPFHISTIKNVSTSVEADYTYLRINFHHPGGFKDSANFQNPDATYVKEMSYRASNLRRHGEASIPATNLNNTYRIIKEVLKRFRSREAEERERANLVEQDELVVDHAKGAFRLKDLYIRPNIVSKRITGTLETHTNGFRFTSIRGDKVDILYNNIKHAFYQPCDGEMIILLHFHLKNPIMYGKKKQQDIQFYTEVGELTTDLSKAHSRMADRDDLEAEQREREMREEIKSAFRSFVDKSEALARRHNLEFETPFRDLGFYGCPHRTTVFLMPTSSTLISVTEMPPFVVTLDEVEFVMLERVCLSIKTFDMVFVFKDYHRKPSMVNSIPSTSLELVKEWLLSCDIFYAEGTKSLNWPKLMKTILDDPENFIEQGGWSFISPEEDEEENEEDTDEEDENYAPSVSELTGGKGEDSSEAGSSEEDEDEDSDWEAEQESDEPESLDSDESEGKDWDELEAEARREDAKNLLLDEEVGQKSKKQTHTSDKKSSKSKHHQR
ncbi:unnamed protein product [Calicophoron daubneyi]|uniref:FACT complex subunit n=1 Tax=Calicophoron daubneyi TaxID=300641 RepID=A0AAV2TIR9_CALDB